MMLTDTPKVLNEKFDTEFEHKVLQLCLRDHAFACKHFTTLKPQYFGSIITRSLFESFYAYFKQYKKSPSKYELTLSILKEYNNNEDMIDKLKTVIESVYVDQVPNADYFDGLIIDFIKKAELSTVLWKAVQGFDTLDLDSFRTQLSDISAIQSVDKNLGTCSTDFINKLALKDDDTSGVKFCTYKTFNNIVRGGLRPGELVVFLAPTNRGKTMALLNFGRSFLTMGSTVVHYSLEMSEEDIMERYIASMTRTKMSDLASPTYYNKVVKALQNYDVFTDKHLYIKYFSAKTAGVSDLEAHFERLKDAGVDPDLIILDYADLLKPPRDRRDKRFELGELYEQVRAFGATTGCAVLTASQTNRQGELNDFDFKTRKRVETPNTLDITHIAEDWSKASTADYIFGIRRPFKHPAVEGELLIMDTLKSRHSRKDILLGFDVEFDKSYMDDILLDGITLDATP